MNPIKLLALAAALGISPLSFGQNLLLNGGFEDGGDAGTLVTTSADSATIVNWTLQTSTSSSTFFVFTAPGGNEPNPEEGTHLLNIGGFGSTKGVGRLWQDFTTTAGETYDVGFYFGRTNNDPAATENVSVRASTFDIQSGSPTGGALNFIDSGNAPATGTIGNLIWVAFQFTATGSTSRLLLQDTTVSSGPSLHLDAISVAVAVPEPTPALLAFGTGAIVLLGRRRVSV